MEMRGANRAQSTTIGAIEEAGRVRGAKRSTQEEPRGAKWSINMHMAAKTCICI